MAKQSKPTVKNRTKKNEFTTISGVVVKVLPISMVEMTMAETAIEKRYREDGLLIDAPTYSVSVAGVEDAEIHSYTEQTIAEEKDEKVLKAWVQYRAGWDKLQDEMGEIRQEIMFIDGIDADPDEDDTWKKRQIRRGIEIPKDPDARKLHWIRSVLLITTDDILNAVETIMTVSMGGAVPADVLASVKTNFRSVLQEATKESE